MKERLRAGHRQEGNWIYVPVEDIKTPEDGAHCYARRWWKVTEANEVLFWKTYAHPQCNSDERTLKHRATDIQETTNLFIDMAYVPWSIEETL